MSITTRTIQQGGADFADSFLARVSLFDKFQIYIGDKHVSLEHLKERMLLAYLAFHASHTFSEADLMDLLWPDDNGRSPLQTALTHIKQQLDVQKQDLGLRLHIDNEQIGLMAEASCYIDVAQFDRQVDRAKKHQQTHVGKLCAQCREHLQTAVALFRGQFLSKIPVGISDNYDEWLIIAREQYHRQAIDILITLLKDCLDTKNWTTAVVHANHLLTIEPWNETAYRALMQSYAKQDQMDQVHAIYEQCRQELSTRIGVSPSVITNSLYQAIQAEKPFDDYHATLPTTDTLFIGRQTEIAELMQLIYRSDSRLITILGAGGMGKSRLATEIGDRLMVRTLDESTPIGHVFVHGTHFVPLVSLREPDHIVPAIAHVLGLQLDPEGGEQKEQLLRYLQNRSLCLILDNFEHLIDGGVQLVAEILQSSLKLKILITSRQRLDLNNETVFELNGLPYPTKLTQNNLQTYEAVQLFVQSASRTQPDFSLTDENRPHVARICQLTYGAPLAIVLAAAWIDTLLPFQIASQIQQDIDFLARETIDLPPRQQSIRATFEHSWRLLDEQEQWAFASMSIFPSSFSRQAVQEIIGAPPRILARLRHKSLLTRNHETGRFYIHELLRQFGMEVLVKATGIRTVAKAHGHYYLSYLADAKSDLCGGDQIGAIARLDADFENIRSAWLWAVDAKEAKLLTTAVVPLALFCEFTSKRTAAVEAFAKAIPQFPANQYPKLQIRLRNAISRWQPMTIEQRSSQLGFVRQHGDPEDIANWLIDYWETVDVTGLLSRGHPEIIDWAKEAIVICQQNNDLFGEANAAYMLGYINIFLQEDSATVIEQFTRSLTLHQQSGNMFGQALCTMQLGYAHSGYLGDHEIALNYALESVRLNHSVGAFGMRSACQALAIWMLFYLGRMDEARQMIDEALAAAHQTGLGMAISQVNVARGYLACFDGEYEEALAWVADFEQIDPNQLRIFFLALHIRGLAYNFLGDVELAWQYVKPRITVYLTSRPANLAVEFPFIAMLADQVGETTTAVTFMSLARNHKWSSKNLWKQWTAVNEFEQRLKTKLPPEAYQTAWQRGIDADLTARYQEAIDLIDAGVKRMLST